MTDATIRRFARFAFGDDACKARVVRVEKHNAYAIPFTDARLEPFTGNVSDVAEIKKEIIQLGKYVAKGRVLKMGYGPVTHTIVFRETQ